MRRFLILGLLVLAPLAAAASALPDGPAAEAEPIAGAGYKGTTSPTGTVSFTVSADGATVSDFALAIAATGPGWACAISAGVPESMPIENDAFAYQDGSTSVSGSFPTAGEAEGTFSFERPGPASECDSGTWTATTTATPLAPTPRPPVAATPSGPECPPDSECLPLIAGVCQFVTWSGEDDTSPAELAALVRPAENLQTLWAQQPVPDWKGYSPEFAEAGDMEPVDQLDVVAVCMAGPGEFARPLI